MKRLWVLAIVVLAGAIVPAGGFHLVQAGQPSSRSADTFARQVMFEVTYAHRDLTWWGDPASPTSSAYPRPGARPVATDMHVRTTIASHLSPQQNDLHAARITLENNTRTVRAFTANREQIVGTIDAQGHFMPNDFYTRHRELLPSWPVDAAVLAYDASRNMLYQKVDLPGPRFTESLDFLPLDVQTPEGQSLAGRFAIEFTPAQGTVDLPVVSLTMQSADRSVTLARATVPSALVRGDTPLGSFDNASGTYLAEAAYRPGAPTDRGAEPCVTFALVGEFTPAVRTAGQTLVVSAAVGASEKPAAARTTPPAAPGAASAARIAVDGNFDDWRNVAGVDDPRGDLVPYLEYVPDVDLLEFKVAHDQRHIYLYARVAGQVGRSHPDGGRGYFYAYLDVDQNAGTGFLPTRDDDCYYGVDIGDDCEVQFEFVNNALRKTFYGFCGLGGDDDVLKQHVTVGPSQYGRFDEHGRERAHYKSEYIVRDGTTEITEDLKLGTSDTIQLAISPDGCEVEVVSDFAGFLQDPQGRPTLAVGRTIDLAVGMECDSRAFVGKSRWAADSTRAIRGYPLRPADPQVD